jgi:hypothetical protein
MGEQSTIEYVLLGRFQLLCRSRQVFVDRLDFAPIAFHLFIQLFGAGDGRLAVGDGGAR